MRQQEEKLWRGFGGDIGARAPLAELKKEIVEHIGARRQRGALRLAAKGARSEGDVDTVIARDIERLPAQRHDRRSRQRNRPE